MKKLFKKSICLFILSSFILTAFISCGGAGNEELTTTGGNTSTTSAVTTTGKVLADVPVKDYTGHVFNVMTVHANRVNWFEWIPRDIYAEKENGDVLNDAVYARNRIIEEKYKITIKEDQKAENDIIPAITKMVNAGDDTHDIVLPRLQNVAALALEGMFTNLFDIDYLDMEKPWWNQAGVSQLSIGKKLFFAQGDLLVIDNDALNAMLFNKKVLAEEGLEDPYKLVLDGKWTIDKLIEMSKDVAKDLNGDTIMSLLDDKFGIIMQKDSTLSYFMAAGGNIVSKDKDDLPIISFGSQKDFTLLEKITVFMQDSQNVVDLHRYNQGTFSIYDAQAEKFSDNKALFTWIRMRVVEKLRSMDADFGILPIPKYDDKQESYLNVMNPYVSTAIAIPKSVKDLERAGIILEALSAESKYTLQPAYMELNLKTKFARDEESREMLKIIFDNTKTIYNIAEIYKFGNFAGDIAEIPTGDRDPNYASLFESKKSIIQADIDKFITNYENMIK